MKIGMYPLELEMSPEKEKKSTKMEKFWIDLCPLQGSFFSQFGAENSKRHGVYLQKKGPPSAIYNFNLYGQNARFGGFSTFS